MELETIRVERPEDGVAVITLSRPEVRNAIDQAMVTDLHRALDGLAAGGDVRAAVLTGAGEKAFAAGADIRQLLERTAADAFKRINSAIFERIEEAPFAVIAAIRGFALGGGCELAAACDMRVAGRSARFGQPEVGLGIIPGAGATYRLPRLIGFGKARELILTGRVIDAEEALRIGLIDHLVEDGEVVDRALALAREVARNAPLAVRLSKTMLNAAARGARLGDLESLCQALTFDSEDKRARMQAFLDRRKKRG